MNNNLTNEEKLYLLICLMKDMRGSWADNCEKRANLILELAKDLDIKPTIKLTKSYLSLFTDKSYTGDYDGRHFRTSWDFGGYENAPLPDLKVFSKELLSIINDVFEFPEHGLPTK